MRPLAHRRQHRAHLANAGCHLGGVRPKKEQRDDAPERRSPSDDDETHAARRGDLGLDRLAAFWGRDRAFYQEAFASAQADGDSILVHINAPWCPTCRAQRPIIEELEKSPKFEKLKVFRVDFDSQSDIVRSFRATSQSTLIVFKGKAETGRSVGETDPDAIAALLEKAL